MRPPPPRAVRRREATAWLRWLPTFVAFPVGATLAHAVAGPAAGLPAALLGGGPAGLAPGAAQALALRPRVPAAPWLGASAAGLAGGLALATAAVAYHTGPVDLAVQGAVSGAALGAAQALVLRGRLPGPWRWAPLTAAAWALGWTVTRAIGVDVAPQWTVFGSGGALVATALTALLPVAFARRSVATASARRDGTPKASRPARPPASAPRPGDGGVGHLQPVPE
jgi:hypothetical protein